MESSAPARSIGSLALEAVAIVFSVLVALAVDEWREARQNRALVERSASSIAAEVRANRAAVRKALAYHDSLAQAMVDGRHQQMITLIPAARLGNATRDARTMRAMVMDALAGAGVVFNSPGTLLRTNDSTYQLLVDKFRGTARLRPQGVAIFVEKGVTLAPAFVRNVAWETARATQAPLHMDYPLVDAMSALDQLQQNYLADLRSTVGQIYAGEFTVYSLYDLAGEERALMRQYDRIARLLPAVDSAPPDAKAGGTPKGAPPADSAK